MVILLVSKRLFCCKMWILLLTCLCIILLYHKQVNGSPTCHHDWIHYGSSCYLFVQQNETWANAMVNCKAFGAHLVEIQSSKEDHFILSRLRNGYRDGIDRWVGASDFAGTGHWEWAESRDLIGYTNWAPGEPNRSSGGCMQLYHRQLYLWDDVPCNDIQYYICEEELGPQIIG